MALLGDFFRGDAGRGGASVAPALKLEILVERHGRVGLVIDVDVEDPLEQATVMLTAVFEVFGRQGLADTCGLWFDAAAGTPGGRRRDGR